MNNEQIIELVLASFPFAKVEVYGSVYANNTLIVLTFYHLNEELKYNFTFKQSTEYSDSLRIIDYLDYLKEHLKRKVIERFTVVKNENCTNSKKR